MATMYNFQGFAMALSEDRTAGIVYDPSGDRIATVEGRATGNPRWTVFDPFGAVLMKSNLGPALVLSRLVFRHKHLPDMTLIDPVQPVPPISRARAREIIASTTGLGAQHSDHMTPAEEVSLRAFWIWHGSDQSSFSSTLHGIANGHFPETLEAR